MYWRAKSERLLVREWEGSVVLFQRDTGSTHFFDGFEALVFSSLQSGPISEEQLRWTLQQTFESTSEDMVTAVRRMLVALEKLRLVEGREPEASV